MKHSATADVVIIDENGERKEKEFTVRLRGVTSLNAMRKALENRARQDLPNAKSITVPAEVTTRFPARNPA